jgi:sterol 14-demethylase
MKIVVDMDLCQGHSVCLEEAPEVFDVVETDEGYPKVKVLIENPSEELRDKVEKAVKYCPNKVIKIIEE